MTALSRSIFICYRRDDSADVVGRIYDRLLTEFGKEAIFRDVDTIPLGVDFSEHIKDVLRNGRVGLVVIGQSWLSIQKRSGQSRLHELSDHVRIEVETMLAAPGIRTIPLYVSGARSLQAIDLPESMHRLERLNGLAIRRDPDFHHDMDRLINAIWRVFETEAPALAEERSAFADNAATEIAEVDEELEPAIDKEVRSKDLELTNSQVSFLALQNERLLYLREMVRNSSSGIAIDPLHSDNEGSDAYDRNFVLSLLSKEADPLHEIEEAIKRLENGTYGVCGMCGKLIPKERLEAIPYGRFTVDCQAALEKQQGTK